MFSDDLKATLILNEPLLVVYFNDSGEWAFDPLAGFVTAFSRDEVLAEITPPVTDQDTAKTAK